MSELLLRPCSIESFEAAFLVFAESARIFDHFIHICFSQVSFTFHTLYQTFVVFLREM